MDATIRDATPEDASAVRRVARKSWHAAYDDILGVETVDSVVDDWYDAEGLARSVRRDDGRFLVAESSPDAGIVGFAQAVLGDGGANAATDGSTAAELPRIYVHPDRWAEGVGSALLDRIESWCREEGAGRLRLLVLADNEVGNAFYEARGYRTVGSRESEFEGQTVTDYVREKEL
ncbi:GNAT family N-acetyltransferase [Halorussus litoreus]|uniref:GNAT family N-acetyltransferase n=1 Tax=Halorussus litoreus TaxID=1710536 RepID=UPI000E235AF7|nr:GNAT family N-acetyltransferase [Halorussus litoreus]